MLNCVPLAITSFRKIPHQRLPRIYNQVIALSTHSARESGRELGPENPLRAVFMGTPQFAVPALDALASNPALDLVAVYAPPDRRRGRGRIMEPSPIKARARELEIPVCQPSTLRNPDAIVELSQLKPEIIVVVAYGRLLPAEVLDIPRFGCLNLHPSLLPRYRGPSPVPGAILSGDETTGITLMLLDEGMDSGPIIAQRTRNIGPDDDAESLTAELFREGAALLDATLPGWVSGDIDACPQDHELATFTSKMERADGLADWRCSAEALWRQQRAYTPWPGLHTSWDGRQELKLLKVEPWDAVDVVMNPLGQVVGFEDAPSPICISVGEGLLAAHVLQLEGRRPAAAADFLRGYPKFMGARLG